MPNLKFSADTTDLDDAFARVEQQLGDLAQLGSQYRQQDAADDAAYWRTIAAQADAAAGVRQQQMDAERRDQLALNSTIASSAASGLVQMLCGRESFTEAAEALGDRLLQKTLDIALRDALNWIEGETMKTAATAAGTASRTATETAGAATTTAINASTASEGILAKAADAAAGAFDAMAGIPVVGPALGAAAAAATYAAVIAYGSLFSAAGGWDRVPYDNALTALHKDEMVLSAPYAGVIRGLAGGSGGGFSPQITQNLTVGSGSAGLSQAAFRRMLSDNADHLVGILKNLHRNAVTR